jgi:hypothetical protein
MRKAALVLLLATSCIRREYTDYCETNYCNPCCVSLMEAIEEESHPRYSSHGYAQTSHAIPATDIAGASILLRMKQGDLWMAGGTEDLLNADLKYPRDSEAPKILSLTAGSMRQVDLASQEPGNRWHLALNKEVPLSLGIESEGGVRNLNLEDIPLNDFYLHAMSGPTLFSPTGSQPYLTAFEITQDQGDIALQMGGDYKVLSEATIYTAIGNIAGRFDGYFSRLQKMHITAIEGDVELDLSGAWERPLHLKVTATCGDTCLRIPCGLGASVRVHKGPCAEIDMGCMRKKWASNAYVNEAYGKTDAFLDIEVYMTDGRLSVQETR